jgi:hypothetical protein
MKVLVDEVKGEGLEKLTGEIVTLYCNSYIYSGLLSGVNDTCVKLSNALLLRALGSSNR